MLKGNTTNINLKNLINHKARCNRLNLESRTSIVNWDLYGGVCANQVKAWIASWSIPYPWTTVWFVSRIATQLSKITTTELCHRSVMSWKDFISSLFPHIDALPYLSTCIRRLQTVYESGICKSCQYIWDSWLRPPIVWNLRSLASSVSRSFEKSQNSPTLDVFVLSASVGISKGIWMHQSAVKHPSCLG